MIWEEVLNKILLYETPIKKVADKVLRLEELKSLDIRTLDFSKFHYDFAVATDVLGDYHPITSEVRVPPVGSKIIYDIEKIVFYADKNLESVCESLGLGMPCEDIIKAFRWAFSHAIRRHAYFHYLVERACRLMAECRYEEYRVKVYNKRRELGQPNLEEALADAYSIVYVDVDLGKIKKFLPHELKSEDLIIVLKKWIRGVFLSNNRPAEFYYARKFISEFESLRDIEDNPEEIKKLPVYSISLRGTRALDGVFRGLSWLFHEITVVEPVNFTEKTMPPMPPYPIRDFFIFLENFRRDDTLFMMMLLPPAEEIKLPSKRPVDGQETSKDVTSLNV